MAEAPASTSRRRLGWKGWVLAAPLILGLVLILVWCAWLWVATSQQNAAVARLRDAGLPATFEEHLRDIRPLDDSENAAVDFLAAIELMDTQAPAWTALQEWRTPETEMTAPERAQWLKLQADVAIEQAAAIRRVEPVDAKIRPAVPAVKADFGAWSALKAEIAAGRMPNDPISIALPSLNHFRSLGKLLAADARLASAAGDGERAMRHVIRVIGLADAVDADGHSLVEHLVAIGVRVLGASVAIDLARDGVEVPDEVRREAISVLFDDAPVRAGYARSIQGEAAFQLEVLRALDEGRVSLSSLGGGEEKAGGRFLTVISAPVLRGDAAQIADFLRAWHATADAPDWPAVVAGMPAEEDVATGSLLDVYASILLPSLDRATEADFRCRTELHLAAAALAIAAFRDDNVGRWPQSLDELVPAYLPAPPRDAMAAGAPPLRYDPARKLLWSVGTDGVDDGGDATSTRANGQKSSRWDGKDAVVELERPK